MPKELSEVYLNDSHQNKVDGFHCIDKAGCRSVQDFLQNEALDYMKRNIARTRLFFEGDNNLVGFYSLFNDTIKINRQKRESMDIRLPHGVSDIPAIRLHFIGVDNAYQSKGFGEYIMGSVLDNCIEIARSSGCSLIVVESTESAKGFYEKLDFTYVRPENGYNIMAMGTKGLIEFIDL